MAQVFKKVIDYKNECKILKQLYLFYAHIGAFGHILEVLALNVDLGHYAPESNRVKLITRVWTNKAYQE